MVTCTGNGDSGDHCCYINGKICEFLTYEDSLPRCSLWGRPLKDLYIWKISPVGRWFDATHPGYDCYDWPQNIPEAMAAGRGLCCWQGD